MLTIEFELTRNSELEPRTRNSKRIKRLVPEPATFSSVAAFSLLAFMGSVKLIFQRQYEICFHRKDVSMSKPSKIWPIVVYPFAQPRNLSSLGLLYAKLADLNKEDLFHKPVTVLNNQTKYRSSDPASKDPQLKGAYTEAMKDIVSPVSALTETWAVDTCAMWLRGLGDAFQQAETEGAIHDVFWLIPGDFDYSTKEGLEALDQVSKIPLRVHKAECELCLGEITVPLNSAKQLIDTYGTYGLLYNWFPAEAQGIREVTDKPRTEFFALNSETLKQALIPNRWYAYEQTLMILLQNMNGRVPVRRIAKVRLGSITDPEAARSSLASAMQQVERTERALKLYWRELAERQGRLNWHDEFRALDAQSESVRTAAMVILRRLLA